MKIKIAGTNWVSDNNGENFKLFFIIVNGNKIWNYEILLRDGNLKERLLSFKAFKKDILGKTQNFQRIRPELGLPFCE